MKVRTLVAWAGSEFSYATGDVIDHEISDDAAQARVDAGLAEIVPEEAPPVKRPARR
jgi:hypothetical protein